MTSKTGMWSGLLGLVCAAAIASSAAAGPQALSPWDAQRYRAAFAAMDQGDFVEAELQSADIKDRALAGHLSLRSLMHPTHRASYEELAAWLAKYADLPDAERVYTLAMKRKPAGAKDPKTPAVRATAWSRVELAAQTVGGRLPADKARAAREAFYSGDVTRAYQLAQASGERWIAGLSAYRLKDYAAAQGYFVQVAQDDGEDAWLRAAAAFWAARSAGALGDRATEARHLRTAASHPQTFYGMIAERQSKLMQAERETELSQAPKAETGEFVLASYDGPSVDLTKFIKSDERAHRAVALAQVGQTTAAGLELRAGLALAKTQAERDRWGSLIMALNAPLTSQADAQVAPSRRTPARPAAAIDYPTPALEPKWGFTIDKALVYAIVNQESRFNPQARSPAGAVGLMQLMPEAAARAAGDDKLKADMSPLLDPAFNLRVGQDYMTWLMERGVGYDLLQVIAAYNGGPGTLLRTAQLAGPDADSLMIIECLPAQETRNYVEKVMAGYWHYRRKFGQDSKILDALAGGAKTVDARLDASS